MKIQIDRNVVTVDGTPAFVRHMEAAVVAAIATAPLNTARPAKRPVRAPKGSAPAKPRRKGGKRPGRKPGRTVEGKYIAPGTKPPKGYREVKPGGKIVAVKG